MLQCAAWWRNQVGGLRRAFVLVVMHLKSRTILLAEATFSPHNAWMEQQVRNVLWECEDMGIQPRFLIHHRDACLCASFDTVLKNAGVKPIKTRYHSPNANAYCEPRMTRPTLTADRPL